MQSFIWLALMVPEVIRGVSLKITLDLQTVKKVCLNRVKDIIANMNHSCAVFDSTWLN